MKKHLFTISAVRRLIFFAMLLLSYVLQFIIIPRTALPFPLLLLIPVAVSVTVFEYEFAGLLWGLLAGVLWDFASPVTDGLYALIFPVIFLFTGLLTRYVLRNTCLTASIFTAVFSLIPSVLGLIYDKNNLTGEFILSVMRAEMLPALISSVIILIPVYFLTSAVYRRFSAERF